jgi:hypothetical protein
MKITKIGYDYITIDEAKIQDEELLNIPRVHLIKLDFQEPDATKIDAVMTLWNKTNRFVIEDNIKIYNSILKRTAKKYYVENKPGTGFISFFRKNNKILLNTVNFKDYEREFIFNIQVLPDLLRNIEVIQLHKADFEKFEYVFEPWNGNVILEEE